MRLNRRYIVALLVVILIGAIAGGWYALGGRGRFRKRWKDDAVAWIENRLSDPDHVKDRLSKQSKNADDPAAGDTGPAWLTDEAIFMASGEWILYKATGHKEDARISDIFIARASNGRWYYSTFHFCREMASLHSMGRPPDLAAFIATCSLVEFDGESDEALSETWDGELRPWGSSGE
jgi:hypothetical protein